MEFVTTLARKAPVALLGVVIVLALGFMIETVEAMPPHAIVAVDDKAGRYATPSCVKDHDVDESFVFDRLVRAEDARARGYKPEPVCVNEGGFSGSATWLGLRMLEKVGIDLVRSRWNADGSWNW